ncbi:MAG: hypothetical protein WCK25_02160 [Actinomycetes bacterium]
MSTNSVKPAPGYIDRSRAKAILEKWAPILNYSSDKVAPLENEHSRLTTAILMENQEAWCLNESSPQSGGSGSVFGAGATGNNGNALPGGSDWYASNDARLPKVLIPMIRRTFPELITNEIVGVQPMSGPVGLAFALRYYYDGSNPLGATTGGSDGVTQAGQAWNTGNANEVGFQNLDTRYTGTSSSSLSGRRTSDVSALPMLSGFNVEDIGVAQLLSSFELTGNIPTMTLQFSKTAVEAGTRRLAAKWSVELEQDLKNMNGLDVDAELTNAMSYEIQAEIDREVVIRMIQTCLNAGSGSGYSFWYAQSADARWLGERNRDFYAKVIIEANRVAIRNRRGSANFIIATPKVCAIMEMLPEFQWMAVNGNINTQPTGIAKVGTLGGRFTVYRDTRTESRQINASASNRIEYALLGYKGSEYYDTGIVYCPYIPVMIQRTIGPNDFAPRVGLMTRYGIIDHIFGASLYYHLVIVQGLGSAFQASQSQVTYLP